ncbi:MAG: anti-sigma factor, partial [Planctomycetes bacterium]|nr:anti-sigma factor [Planctomycetota bacterium]
LILGGRGDGAPPAERRAALLASGQALVRWSWQPGPSPLRGEPHGEVVWSTARQEGYLTFRGLPPLDPEHRFQLWIVDGQREGAPVDGGVFAIEDPSRETVVPVHAALPIGRPAAFVVTVEDKAGVVVSKQEHVVALAGL